MYLPETIGPGCAFLDYDNDGRLDLFVCRFGDFSKSKNQVCGNRNTGAHYYCAPGTVEPLPCWLFHNNGDGTFTDVSRQCGIGALPARAWGVVAADVNQDGWMDLFVANDKIPNFLLMNRGGKKFADNGLLSGVAYNPAGGARSGMGVDAADYDEDGAVDLFVANFVHESYSLYRNAGNGNFDDMAAPSGIAKALYL